MRALLKAPLGKSHIVDEITVELLARTRARMIVVQGLNRGAAVFSVDRYRLFAETDRTRKIADSALAALPWRGKGPDPDTASIGALLDHAARSSETPQ